MVFPTPPLRLATAITRLFELRLDIDYSFSGYNCAHTARGSRNRHGIKNTNSCRTHSIFLMASWESVCKLCLIVNALSHLLLSRTSYVAWNSLGICSSKHRPGKSIAWRLVAFKRPDTSLDRLRRSLTVVRVSVPFAPSSRRSYCPTATDPHGRDAHDSLVSASASVNASSSRYSIRYCLSISLAPDGAIASTRALRCSTRARAAASRSRLSLCAGCESFPRSARSAFTIPPGCEPAAFLLDQRAYAIEREIA